ncbi:MAG: M48 family metalloprotease [Fuerstiella sp.]|nr:M48 family metalloprotease [Fuerstiella sp.]MCP4853907.1 M48 family metalloprotease [Fuerstiella sp.]
MESGSDESLTELPQHDRAPVVVPSYHQALLKYLKKEESDLWNWFSSNRVQTESAEVVRLELLKTAYRIGRETAADLYGLVDVVADRMGFKCPVTLYQAQNSVALNASLAWLPHEAHVVFFGPVQEALTNDELSALLVHELAHHELFSIQDSEFLITEQILSAMISDTAADASHDRTSRNYQLHTELHCDRRALQVTDNLEACVCMLVKMETGLKDVSAASYIEQANEVLSTGPTSSDGITHPEMFIRAKALQLWHDEPNQTDAALQVFVEGPLGFRQMDLLGQRQVTDLTMIFLQRFLRHDWLQTDLVLGHAKRFFEDFRLPDIDIDVGALTTSLSECDAELKSYFGYLLLDLVTCDADLEEAPLAAAFLFVNEVGMSSEFATLVTKELRISRRVLRKVETNAPKIVQHAEKEFVS